MLPNVAAGLVIPDANNLATLYLEEFPDGGIRGGVSLSRTEWLGSCPRGLLARIGSGCNVPFPTGVPELEYVEAFPVAILSPADERESDGSAGLPLLVATSHESFISAAFSSTGTKVI